MSMEFDHGPDCGHCRNGCTHPHDEHEPPGLSIGPTIACAPGDLMRNGGAYINRDGITIASDNWHPVICAHCSSRSMAPTEALPGYPFMPAHDEHGNLLSRCGPCKADIRDGYKPGTGPHTARARRRQR